jgi:hypothetical protein
MLNRVAYAKVIAKSINYVFSYLALVCEVLDPFTDKYCRRSFPSFGACMYDKAAQLINAEHQ